MGFQQFEIPFRYLLKVKSQFFTWEVETEDVDGMNYMSRSTKKVEKQKDLKLSITEILIETWQLEILQLPQLSRINILITW